MEQQLVHICVNEPQAECLEQIKTTQTPLIITRTQKSITKLTENKFTSHLKNSCSMILAIAFIVFLFLLLNWYFAPEVMATLIVTIGGGATFWFTKKKERETEVRREKNDVYREFISKLVKIITYPNEPACQIGGSIDNELLEIMNKLAILSSTKILDKLIYYRDYKIVDSWRRFYDLKPIQSNKERFKETIEELEFGYYALYDPENGDYEIIVKKRCHGYKIDRLSDKITYENGTIYIKYEDPWWTYCIMHRNGDLFTGKIHKTELPEGFPEDENLISQQFIQHILYVASKTCKIDLELIRVIESVINLNNDDKNIDFVKNEILKLFSENQMKPITLTLLDAIRKEIGVTNSGESYNRYPFINI